MDNVVFVIWGGLFGNFTIQVFLGIIAFLICTHGLTRGKVPLSTIFGFMFAALRGAFFYAILSGMGFYMTRSWFHIRHINEEPLFLIFTILGAIISLIPVPGKIVRFWNCTHYSFAASLYQMRDEVGKPDFITIAFWQAVKNKVFKNDTRQD